MHREGHVGIGLLLYSPFAYWFVSNDLMLLFGTGMVAIAAWSFLPDIDMGLPIRHRGPTHTITAAIIAGVLTVAAFAYLIYSGLIEFTAIFTSAWLSIAAVLGFGFVFGFLGVIGHIIGDVLTPMGVRPFWPLANYHFSLDVVYAADKEANKQLSYLGAVALTVAIALPSL